MKFSRSSARYEYRRSDRSLYRTTLAGKEPTGVERRGDDAELHRGVAGAVVGAVAVAGEAGLETSTARLSTQSSRSRVPWNRASTSPRPTWCSAIQSRVEVSSLSSSL